VGGRASHAQCLRAGKKANFWRQKNLPFCTRRMNAFSRAGIM